MCNMKALQCISSGLKVIAKVKVGETSLEGQCHKVKNTGTM